MSAHAQSKRLNSFHFPIWTRQRTTPEFLHMGPSPRIALAHGNGIGQQVAAPGA
jgi:hypothetical protein